ncbi:MAG: type II toxin-antitoxin system RelB/DinJ family antitoxin [Ruminococcus sp.]|nr:type II toxin-antitoxin system RelB/DinJ family antitoxin [Ruminococcus sp.]
MSMTTITVKVPTDIYEQAKSILMKHGLTVEDACVLFLEETVAQGKIPFSYTQEDIEEVRKLEISE